MNGIWLISYLILWLLVLGGGTVILILAHEIELLRARLEEIERNKNQLENSQAPHLTRNPG